MFRWLISCASSQSHCFFSLKKWYYKGLQTINYLKDIIMLTIVGIKSLTHNNTSDLLLLLVSPQKNLEKGFIQWGAKKKTTKKRNIVKIDFLIYLYLSKYTLLYIKLKAIGWNPWWCKLYIKTFYNKHFILLWKRPLKNMSHKERNFQGKRRNLFCLNMEVERKENKTKLNRK